MGTNESETEVSNGTSMTVILAVAGIVAFAFLAVMAIIIWGPAEPTSLIVQVLGFTVTISGTMLALINSRTAAIKSAHNTDKIQEVKVSIDGRMEQLLSMTEEAAKANATIAEQKVGAAIAADLAVTTASTLAEAIASPAVVVVPEVPEIKKGV